MPSTRTRRGTAGCAASALEPAMDVAAYSPRAAAMIALQRSAGNAATAGLMRRAHEEPLVLTIPGVVDRAVVDSYSLEYDGNHKLVGLSITRSTDADSPRLAKASMDGPSKVTAVLVVRGPRVLTITMENCLVSSFTVHGNYDSVGLRFDQPHLDYAGASQ